MLVGTMFSNAACSNNGIVFVTLKEFGAAISGFLLAHCFLSLRVLIKV